MAQMPDQMTTIYADAGAPKSLSSRESYIETAAQGIVEFLRAGFQENRAVLRELGEHANASGGFGLMQDINMRVREMHPHGEGGPDGWHPAELDWVWNGIGDWLA